MSTKKEEAKEKQKSCFIIMPIADVEGYPKGHFNHVYENIITPACELANFKPVRADEVKQTNLIHLDILKKLIESPIAICDLSSRNPNVLFELGVRQAFDKPVVLIQEEGTPKIFDISPLRYLEYCKKMKYHDVLSIQNELKVSIEATFNASSTKGSVNSIVKLLALSSPAKLPNIESNRESLSLDLMQAEIREIKSMIAKGFNVRKVSIEAVEYERLSNEITRLKNDKNTSPEEKFIKFEELFVKIDKSSAQSLSKEAHRHYSNLSERILRSMGELA